MRTDREAVIADLLTGQYHAAPRRSLNRRQRVWNNLPEPLRHSLYAVAVVLLFTLPLAIVATNNGYIWCRSKRWSDAVVPTAHKMSEESKKADR